MEVKLRKIKRSGKKFDDLFNSIVEFYKEHKTIEVTEDLESVSEPVSINGEEIIVNIDLTEYKRVIAESKLKQEMKPKIGLLLLKDFSTTINGTMIPPKIMNDDMVWAYLSLTVFKDIVSQLFEFKSNGDDDEKIKYKIKDGIKLIYFNIASRARVSRTGLRSIWVMMDMLDAKDNPELLTVAYEFIDAAKAILERKFSNNKLILKAFVQGIINNGKNEIFRDRKYRSKIPSNVSCFSAVNFLDAYDYDELVEVISEQQKLVLNLIYEHNVLSNK